MQTSILTKVYSNSEKLDFCCPVCLFMCRDQADVDSLQDEGACTECFLNFRHIMGRDWEIGKRPSVESAREKMGILKDP